MTTSPKWIEYIPEVREVMECFDFLFYGNENDVALLNGLKSKLIALDTEYDLEWDSIVKEYYENNVQLYLKAFDMVQKLLG